VEIPVERKATIHQFTDRTFSKYSLELQNRESALRRQVVKFIERVGQVGKTLVVASKEVKEALQAEVEMPTGMLGGEMVSFIHFGNLRGLNDYSGYDNVIVIGREQPAANGIEDQARALWWDSEAPILSLPLKDGNKPLSDAHRAYRGGSHPAVKVQVHPDSRVQALLEQAREAESEQALDRLRLLREPAGQPRKVYILSKLPLDVTIDYHHGWERLHRLLEVWEEAEGVLPLSHEHMLKRCPRTVTSRTLAVGFSKDWKMSASLIEVFISKPDTFYRRYRPKNSRSKWSKVVCSGHVSEEQISHVLSDLVGAEVELANHA
jgi:hypothetical protein